MVRESVPYLAALRSETAAEAERMRIEMLYAVTDMRVTATNESAALATNVIHNVEADAHRDALVVGGSGRGHSDSDRRHLR